MTPASRSAISDCLAGGGEMGALIRSFDWSRTRLGPVARWPQSLRTAVGIMLDSAFGMVVAWGPEFVCLYNDRYRPVLGATKHPGSLGKPAKEIFPEAWDYLGPLFEQTRHGEAVALDDVLIPVERNGYLEDCYFTLSYSAIRDESGGVGGMLAVVVETTERVLGERRRAEALAELSRLRREADLQSSRLNALFEQAPAVIVVLAGPDHICRLANGPALESVGNRSVIGLPARLALPELAGQGIVELLDRSYQTGERYIGNELPVRLGRGAQIEQTYWNVVYQPYRDVEGRVEGVMVFGFEITVQVRARQRAEALMRQLQASEAKADAANRAKDEFLAVLGHELRNPLAPILTALQIMRLRDADTGAKERSIIERQAQHLVRLVDDLLDVSRITRGKIELKISRIELADVVARAIEMTSPVLEHRQHQLGVHVPPRGLAVDGDPDRLAQVVSNLLTNAAKYTERGGRITVFAERRGDLIAVGVKDTGIGIAPEMLPRVFDMFVQEPQALDRSRGGLGLGLTIVRSLVAMHGGTVKVHSEGRNRGSEFVVTLPAAVVRPPAGSDGAVAPNGARRGAGAGRRILVVDDNEDAAELLASALEVMGHTTRVAHDGPEALRAAAEFDPDLALLDIGLPVMDGYELARRLHDDPGLRRVPLVAVTGYGQPADRRRSEAAGFDEHLVKPVDIERLGSLIRQLTGDRR